MNKSELIKQVAIQAKLTKPQASLAVDAVLEAIQHALQNGEHWLRHIRSKSTCCP